MHWPLVVCCLAGLRIIVAVGLVGTGVGGDGGDADGDGGELDGSLCGDGYSSNVLHPANRQQHRIK
jgi:hypothetical protein